MLSRTHFERSRTSRFTQSLSSHLSFSFFALRHRWLVHCARVTLSALLLLLSYVKTFPFPSSLYLYLSHAHFVPTFSFLDTFQTTRTTSPGRVVRRSNCPVTPLQSLALARPSPLRDAHWWRLGYPLWMCTISRSLFLSFHPFFLCAQFSTCTSPAQRSTPHPHRHHTLHLSTPAVARPHAHMHRMTKLDFHPSYLSHASEREICSEL